MRRGRLGELAGFPFPLPPQVSDADWAAPRLIRLALIACATFSLQHPPLAHSPGLGMADWGTIGLPCNPTSVHCSGWLAKWSDNPIITWHFPPHFTSCLASLHWESIEAIFRCRYWFCELLPAWFFVSVKRMRLRSDGEEAMSAL